MKSARGKMAEASLQKGSSNTTERETEIPQSILFYIEMYKQTTTCFLSLSISFNAKQA